MFDAWIQFQLLLHSSNVTMKACVVFCCVAFLSSVLFVLCTGENCDGINETWVKCSKPTWCNTCGIRGNCKLTECTPGCDCEENHFRDDKGKCIPATKCPKDKPTDSGCAGNKTENMHKGCVYNCKTYYSPIQICLEYPELECTCKTDYVWETTVGESRCILPKECTESDIKGDPSGGRRKRTALPNAGINCPLGGCFGSCYMTSEGGKCVCKCPPGQES